MYFSLFLQTNYLRNNACLTSFSSIFDVAASGLGSMKYSDCRNRSSLKVLCPLFT